MPSPEDILFEVHQHLKQKGYLKELEKKPDHYNAFLKFTYEKFSDPGVQQAFQSGQMTVPKMVAEIEAGIGHLKERHVKRQMQPGLLQPPGPQVPDFAMEGGLINDQSGRGTQLLRQRGYRVGGS